MDSLRRWRDKGLETPSRTIIEASLTLRAVTSLLLLGFGTLLPSFETDAATLFEPISWWARPFVRWDTVHFVNIALQGYKSEQQSAFLPGLPLLMRTGGVALHWLNGMHGPVTGDELVLAGMLATTVATTAAALCLHRLTQRLFPARPAFALDAALLFLLAPARPVLHGVPYTEPIAALCTFGGMYHFASGRDTSAAMAWAVGSLFRAQGAILGFGFFGWKWILRKSFDERKSRREVFTRLLVHLPRFAFLAVLSSMPFLVFEAYIYRLNCPALTGELRPWCQHGLGLSYGWVQREYWDVGPFRYWTLRQAPNFLLASPVFALSLSASWTFYSRNARTTMQSTLNFLPASMLSQLTEAPTRSSSTERAVSLQEPFTAPASSRLALDLVPYLHLHTFTTLVLLISAHVQIVLRVCATNPVVWWYAAELAGISDGGGIGTGVDRGADRGRAWVKYVTVWGWLATALWAVFLPPA